MDDYNKMLKIYNDKLIANKKRYIENVPVESIEVSRTAMAPVIENQDVGAETRKTLVEQFLRGKFNELTNSNYEVVEYIMGNIDDDQDREFLYSFWNKFEIKVIDMLPKQVSKEMFVKLTKAFLLRESATGAPTGAPTGSSDPSLTSNLPPVTSQTQLNNSRASNQTLINNIEAQLSEWFVDYTDYDNLELNSSYIQSIEAEDQDSTYLDKIEKDIETIQYKDNKKTKEYKEFENKANKLENEFSTLIDSLGPFLRNANKIRTEINIDTIVATYGFIPRSLSLDPYVDKMLNQLKNVSNLLILKNFYTIARYCEKSVSKGDIAKFITSKSNLYSIADPPKPLKPPSADNPSMDQATIDKFKSELSGTFDDPGYKRSSEYAQLEETFNAFVEGPFQIEIYDDLIQFYQQKKEDYYKKLEQNEISLKALLKDASDLTQINDLSAFEKQTLPNIEKLVNQRAIYTLLITYIENTSIDTINAKAQLEASLVSGNTSSASASSSAPSVAVSTDPNQILVDKEIPILYSDISSFDPKHHSNIKKWLDFIVDYYNNPNPSQIDQNKLILYVGNVSDLNNDPDARVSSSGNGLKKAGKRAKNLIKSGSNVIKVDDIYYVDMKQLNKNLLNIKYLKNQNIVKTFAPVLISDELKALVMSALKTKKADPSLVANVSKSELKLFKRFAKILNIEFNSSSNDDEDDDKKFKILLGEYASGNDSEIVRKELKKYVLRALQEGKLSKNVAYQYLIELS